MRIAVIGGTEFIGRHLVETLAARGDEVVVIHRGRTEPADLVECAHIHVDRRDFSTVAGQVKAFGPDAVVDTIALTRGDVDAVLSYLPDVHLVVLSSMDVYRSYELYLAADDTPMPVPLTEESPLRHSRYPYRGTDREADDYHYEKLDVEPAYLARNGTALRLAMIYGPRDPQQREEFVLRRVRAKRTRIPAGPGATLLPRLHVDDAVAAMLLALDRPAVSAGEVFNVGEAATFTIRGWMRSILAAAGHEAELVDVPDDLLPDDLDVTRKTVQHLLVSSQKARSLLGFEPADPAVAITRSVRWHLEHPPATANTGFAADDRALALVDERA
ncbi:NAD-dependent epimerase/dehydratase family protein [Nonomuraea sp. SBT364]|uniref:NAD-dependent epimerase/dehydratase family protein n=1 Tax=Nonomuraea sp. SBT364 TaxID=1580530 RepID=UPI0009E94823|nr:NAD-dependent epimerase/dehydratase family protein [Nonomuraea sp. SBT364]